MLPPNNKEGSYFIPKMGSELFIGKVLRFLIPIFSMSLNIVTFWYRFSKSVDFPFNMLWPTVKNKLLVTHSSIESKNSIFDLWQEGNECNHGTSRSIRDDFKTYFPSIQGSH